MSTVLIAGSPQLRFRVAAMDALVARQHLAQRHGGRRFLLESGSKAPNQKFDRWRR